MEPHEKEGKDENRIRELIKTPPKWYSFKFEVCRHVIPETGCAKKLLTLENARILQKSKELEPIRPVQMNVNHLDWLYFCSLGQELKRSNKCTSKVPKGQFL